MDAHIDDLLTFLNDSPTPWHAIEEVKKRCIQAGYEELLETDNWKIEQGKRYFVVLRDSSFCAFHVPKESPSSLLIASSHLDSPGLKLKPNAEHTADNLLMLGLEAYGSPLLTSWLNRDLGIAGRVFTKDKQGNCARSLVNISNYPVTVPQLAIHLDQEGQKEGIKLNRQDHLAAVAAIAPKDTPYLDWLLHKTIDYDELLDHDLYLYPLEPARFLGAEKELIASYRIDSLLSVHATLTAHLNASSANKLSMALFFDHEEIGSNTAKGASSPLLLHLIERISLALGLNREEYLRLLPSSFSVSVDLAHAKHPNYSDRHEPNHRILLGEGVAFKYNAQQRYASDAQTASRLAKLCLENNLKLQKMVNRGTIPGGSTIGPLQATATTIPTVDIGAPQLSMHSCRELASSEDYKALHSLLHSFYTTD